MGGAIVVLFLLPWLDRSKVRSIRYRGGIYKKALLLFVISFLGLGYLGTQPATPSATMAARVLTAIYFGFFLLMPLYTRWEKTKPVPERLTEQPSIEEKIPEWIETYHEMTEKQEVKAASGEKKIVTRPNPSGIIAVLGRTVKKLINSLN